MVLGPFPPQGRVGSLHREGLAGDGPGLQQAQAPPPLLSRLGLHFLLHTTKCRVRGWDKRHLFSGLQPKIEVQEVAPSAESGDGQFRPLLASRGAFQVSYGSITPFLLLTSQGLFLPCVCVSTSSHEDTTHTYTYTHWSGPTEWPHLNPGCSAVTQQNTRSHSEVLGSPCIFLGASWGESC